MGVTSPENKRENITLEHIQIFVDAVLYHKI